MGRERVIERVDVIMCDGRSRLIRAVVGGRRDVRARRRRRRRGRRPRADGRAVLRGAVQVLLGRLLHLPAVPAGLPAGPGTLHQQLHGIVHTTYICIDSCLFVLEAQRVLATSAFSV